MDRGLINAKCRLYYLLLKKGACNWTDTEVEIAFNLCKDEQVQQVLRERMNNEKAEAHIDPGRADT